MDNYLLKETCNKVGRKWAEQPHPLHFFMGILNINWEDIVRNIVKTYSLSSDISYKARFLELKYCPTIFLQLMMELIRERCQ